MPEVNDGLPEDLRGTFVDPLPAMATVETAEDDALRRAETVANWVPRLLALLLAKRQLPNGMREAVEHDLTVWRGPVEREFDRDLTFDYVGSDWLKQS